jgi:two-component system, response regulator YesN
MLKNWFYRSLLSYIPMVFIITSILISVTFLVINDLTKKEAEKSNQLYIQNIMQTIDNQLRSIDRGIINEIETNDVLGSYFTEPEADRFWENYRVSVSLNDLHISFPLIDSVFLFRHADEMVMSRNTMLHMDNFGDRDFISWLRQTDPYPNVWTDPRVFREFATQGDSKTVVSIIRKVPLLSGNQGFIVANVNVSSIQKIVQDMSHSQISFVALFDKAAEPIFLSESQEYASLQGDHKGISRIQSDYTGWELYSGIIGVGMFDFVSIFSYVWIFSALFTVLLGTIWIIYVSRRQYKPIQSVLEVVRKYTEQKSHELLQKGGYDEFKFIESSIDKLLDEHSHVQKKNKENQIFVKRFFFQELMEGSRPIGLNEWKEKMGELGMPHRFHLLLGVLVEIDHVQEFSSQYDSKDQNLLKYILNSVIHEISPKHSITIWAEWTQHHQLGVLCLMIDESQMWTQVKQQVHAQFEEVRSWVEKHLHFTVSVGVGSAVDALDDISQSFDEAKDALNFKLALGNNCIIHYEDVVAQQKYEVSHHLPLIHAMTQHFRLDEDEWRIKLEQFFANLKHGAYSNHEITNLVNYMMYYLHLYIHELSAEYQVVWRQEGLAEYSGSLSSYESLDELHDDVAQKLSAYLNKVRAIREHKSNYNVMIEVKKYVEEHYRNPDLSLNLLSEQFDIHPNYLSRLFKDELGERFVDYVVSVRISHAKRLLLESKDSIQDIAGNVGYIHPNSFIRTFKKTVGMTPGDYRKKYE